MGSQRGIDLDRGDVLGTHASGQQCGVVAAAGSDLQDAHPRPSIQGSEHDSDNTGVADRGGDIPSPVTVRSPVIDLDHHKVAVIGPIKPSLRVLTPAQRPQAPTIRQPDSVRNEPVTRDGQKRRRPGRGQLTPVGQLVNQDLQPTIRVAHSLSFRSCLPTVLLLDNLRRRT
jgi:hypothetical protein